MTSLVETPHRQAGSRRYSCAACDGAGYVDEPRYRELTETPGPLFIPASQRSPMQEAATHPYVLTVTNKNRKREVERTRRQAAKKAPESRLKRSKKSHPIIADSDDEEGDAAIRDEDGGEGTRLYENDTSDSHDSHPHSADVVSSLQQAVSRPSRRVSTPSPSPSPDLTAPVTPVATPPVHAPIEDAGKGIVESARAEAAATLKLGLGKRSMAPQEVSDTILGAVFAVAGPNAMEDLLGLCRKWREGLIYHTRQAVEDKMAALRSDWESRLPDNEQKPAIIEVHVAAYWASADDADDFVRAIVRRGRLADFWEAFQSLLRPCIKPNPGWKKKFSEVKRLRLLEANQDLDPKGKEYERKARHFERQLQYGERWARLRRDFGPGIFALLPSAVVTNRWIEQELSVTQFDAWLSVLRRHNPPDPLIVERAWYLVEEALSGRPPPKRLRLEDASSADLGRDCRDPSILLPLVDVRDGDEDESFDKDGAFLEEGDIT